MCSGVSLGSACCQSLALVENAQQLTVDEFSGIGGGIGDEVLKNEKALVAAGIAKAGNQIIHAGAQDPGF